MLKIDSKIVMVPVLYILKSHSSQATNATQGVGNRSAGEAKVMRMLIIVTVHVHFYRNYIVGI